MVPNILINLLLLVFATASIQRVGATPSENKNLRGQTQQETDRQLQTITPLQIARLEIINTVNDKTVGPLVNGSTIVLSDLGLTKPTDLNFRAIINDYNTLSPPSLTFVINNVRIRLENDPEYTMCTAIPTINGGTNYLPCNNNVTIGTHRLVVTPYSDRNAKGTIGTPYTIIFTIVPYPISPVGKPTATPVAPKNPTAVPVARPVANPTQVPVASPVTKPTTKPITATSCTVPKFEGDWEGYKKYPIQLGEAQGNVHGHDFVIYSGFTGNFNTLTRRVIALDLRDPIKNNWRDLDPVPIVIGLTHSAHTSLPGGQGITYFCGGYVGPHPGRATPICLKFSYYNPPGQQWEYMPSLPAWRAGGALWYVEERNALLYALGAARPEENPIITYDHMDVWELSLNSQKAGWVPKAKAPVHANHVGFIAIPKKDGSGQRYFFVGGQLTENELFGNLDGLYELDTSSPDYGWIPRKKMPFKRGHISESVVPYKDCGFLVIAGAINTLNASKAARTNDVSYYDIGTDSWTSIGNYSVAVATPICVHYSGYIYCQTGWVGNYLSFRRKIV